MLKDIGNIDYDQLKELRDVADTDITRAIGEAYRRGANQACEALKVDFNDTIKKACAK